MEPTLRTCFVKLASIPAPSSRALSPLTCRCCKRPNLSSSSTARPLRRSASAFLRACSALPTCDRMRRRKFITLLSGAAAWPLAAQAQQPAIPIVGFLRTTSAQDSGHLLAALRQGLRESGYPTDKVTIESRWAEGRSEQLPKLAAELVALNVAAIVGSIEGARAAKEATASIPIVLVTGVDPMTTGLVSSLNRPGGNVTGVSFYDVPVLGKRGTIA